MQHALILDVNKHTAYRNTNQVHAYSLNTLVRYRHRILWAERGANFQLPNSGDSINHATGYHDWENCCKDEPCCHTMNEIHHVLAGSLAHEIDIPQDIGSDQCGEHDLMNWVEELR